MQPELQSDYAQEEPKAGFDIVELVLFGLARFYPWILFFGLLGLAGGLVFSMMQPNRYASVGSFYVKLGEREKVSPEGAIGLSSGGRDAGPAMAELISILRNPVVFERLAKELGPERLLRPFDPTLHDGPSTPSWTRWLHAWQKRLFFPPPKRAIDPESKQALEQARRVAQAGSVIQGSGQLSKILTVQFRAKDPKLAQEAAVTLMRLMRERHREFFSGLMQEKFISEQLAAAQLQRDKLEEEFLEHQRECGFIDLRAEKADLVKEQRDLDTRLVTIDDKLEEIDLRIAQLDEELAAVPPKIMQPVPEKLGPNPAHEKIVKQIELLRVELAKLETTFKPDSEIYLTRKASLEERLQALGERRDATPPEIVVQEATEQEVANPVYTAFMDRKAAKVRERRDLEVQRTIQATTLARDRQRNEERMAALLACEPYHEEMAGKLAEARALASRLDNADEKARAMAFLDASEEMSNLAVLQEPQYMPKKVAPERSLLLIQGLGIGAALGLAFALLRQLLDPKLRYPNSVERALGVKVLGVIPEAKRWRASGRRIRKMAV